MIIGTLIVLFVIGFCANLIFRLAMRSVNDSEFPKKKKDFAIGWLFILLLPFMIISEAAKKSMK